MEISSMTEALQLHAQIIKSQNNGHTANKHSRLSKLFTFSALSPGGDLSHARRLLRSLPSPSSYHYNTMIRAYAQGPHPIQALHFFLSTTTAAAVALTPDNFTFPFLLKACARLALLRPGKQLHALTVKSGLCTDRYITHSLIHMYSNCGASSHAREVFDRMPERDVVSWTAMIAGLVDDGRAAEAVALFMEMVESRGEGVEAVEATVAAVSRACGETGALTAARTLHELALAAGIAPTMGKVGTALVDMYAKCGWVEGAMRVFGEVKHEKDVSAWTAAMSGLASHGKCSEAIELFDELIRLGMRPDERTMTAVLSACRNSGQDALALNYLLTIERDFGVEPTVQHYGCVVDLLARSGRLDEAEELITKMPLEADAALWRTLIWACKVHNDPNRAERLIGHLEKGLSKDTGGNCGSLVLIGNVYSSAGKWAHKARARESMDSRGLVKPPGTSTVEIDGEIHQFIAGDSGHPEAQKIYGKLEEIERELRSQGYEPRVSEVLLEAGDEEKALQLRNHSEKLALAFALLKVGPAREIRIVKNLRSCEDCHGFIKAVSRIYRREITVRDRIRFHRFTNGSCSCQDYW